MGRFLLIGALGGLINGFFGAGGGMVLVPLLIQVGRLPPKEAFASSLCIMAPICLLSACFRAMDGSLDLSAALPYLLGGLGGGSAPSGDPAALKLLGGVVQKLNQPDKNVDLLRALKPHFAPERAARVDNAVRLLQLFSLLPVLRESGILGRFGDLASLDGLARLLGGGGGTDR